MPMEKEKMPRLIDADKLKTIKSIQSGDFNSIETIQKWIDDAPTVEAERVKRGRWIKLEDDYNNHLYECSYCHTWTSLPTEEVNVGNIRYCWSCGAKMDEVEE